MTQIYFNGALHQVTESGSFFENAEGWKVPKEDCIVIDPTDPWKNFTASVEFEDIPAEAKYVVQDSYKLGHRLVFFKTIPVLCNDEQWVTSDGAVTARYTNKENPNWRKAFTTVEAIRQFEESKNQVRHDPTAFKVGDRVRVVRKAEDGEGGWDNSWAENMNRMVGKECTIAKNFDSKGFNMYEGFSYPSFVLELVKHNEEKSYKVSELRKMTLEQLVNLLK